MNSYYYSLSVTKTTWLHHQSLLYIVFSKKDHIHYWKQFKLCNHQQIIIKRNFYFFFPVIYHLNSKHKNYIYSYFFISYDDLRVWKKKNEWVNDHTLMQTRIYTLKLLPCTQHTIQCLFSLIVCLGCRRKKQNEWKLNIITFFFTFILSKGKRY